MKYNYPIKYTAMPIIEQVGWSYGLNELERDYDVVCYIVSKCYLISDKIKYKEDGKTEHEYEVVFPYQKSQYHNWKRVIPTFNNKCTNSNTVEKVFDTYEEALEFTNEKNQKLCAKTWSYLPYSKDLNHQISQKIQEFNNKLSKYKLLEQQILTNTTNLNPKNIKKLSKLIINHEGQTKVLSSTLYEYLNYSTYSNYIIYSVSKEQYQKLLMLLTNKDTSNISSIIKTATPILYHNYQANNKNILLINKNGNVLYYINERGTLISNDNQELPNVLLSAIDNKTEISFTTETLEDIILSFNQDKYQYITPTAISESVLKRTL